MSLVELERNRGWLPTQVRGVRLEFGLDGLIASCVHQDGAVFQLQLSTNPPQGEAMLAQWLEVQGLQAVNAAAAAKALIGRQFDTRDRHSC